MMLLLKIHDVLETKEMMTIRPDIPIILYTGHSNLISEDTAKDLCIQQTFIS